MKNFIIFSAYTMNTNYEIIIKKLESDCKKLSIPFKSLGYKSNKSWVENTMQKPNLILEVWEELKKEYTSLVWIDADANISSYPKYFDELVESDKDFSVFQMGSIARITSGTIFIRLNETMKEFVKKWRDFCVKETNRQGDQKCLRDLISKDTYKKMGIKYESLPYSYCYIFDDTLRKLEPRIQPLVGNPVIVHMQASRDRNNAKSH